MRKYPDEIHKFIAENVQGRTTKELVELVNTKFGPIFNESKMKAYKANHKLKSGTPKGLPAGMPSKQYPAEIKKYIEENYIGTGPKEMADLLNKTFGTTYTAKQINTYYKNHKLNSGLTGWFPKGNVPWNKGKKGVTTGGEETQFKKGNRPHNWVPIGSERVAKDGYIEVKVRDGHLYKNWKLKHVLIWEQHHGRPVPPGHAIIFGDGNNRNFDPENLLLVSRAQLVRMNQKGLIKNDVELTKTGIIIAGIYNRIGELKRKRKAI